VSKIEDLSFLNLNTDDVVINCMGIIKQRRNIDELEFIKVNSIFPCVLSCLCENVGCNLIHITTDCVYDGLGGNYNEYHGHNVSDIYGITKSLGEPEKATVVRTSIIGEEIGQTRSLVEWVKSNKDKEIKGYTNHFWNGITCLQFIKVCESIIENKNYWKDVKHVFSPTSVTKYELVSMISDIYDLNIKIIPHETEIKCDRTLSSSRDDIKISIPELKQQIEEMKKYKLE
jgi:dTDP-4-dehydrorhamnose reductase